MNSLLTETAWIDILAGMIGFAANWMLQSTLLASIGLLVGALLRKRGSAVQSVVYRTALTAAFICPVATFALSQTGFTGWSMEMPQAWVAQMVAAPTEKSATLPNAVIELGSPGLDAAHSGEPVLADYEANSIANKLVTESIDLEPFEATSSVPEAPTAELSDSPRTADEAITADQTLTVTSFGKAAAVATLLWLLVSALLTMRLARAWWKLSHLRGAAVRADNATRDACRQLSISMGVSPPDVRRSPYLPSPCLSGVRSPAILLPESDLNLPMRDVLIHELAHLRRHDCLWNLLRQLATALFFFQPLLWALSRRIETTAEEVCDDFVVQFGGDRQEYAHGLVDIAELSSAPIAAAGVGIVSLRSMLAHRVTRVLDTSRTLSTRVGNLLLVAVLVGGFAGATVTGLIGLAPAPSQAIAAEEAVEIKSANERGERASVEVVSNESGWVNVKGTVVDPDGKPLVGATVEVQHWIHDPDEPKEPVATTTTSDVGRFEIRFPEEKSVTLVASHAGFGAGFFLYDTFQQDEEPTLRLVRDDMPIQGQVVDLEGNPLAGVLVKIGSLAATEDEKLDGWLEAIGRGQILWEATNKYFQGRTPQNPANLPDSITTDSDGSFSLNGIGRERMISLAFEGETIAYTRATVVTREMEPVVANDGMPDPDWSRKHTVYGTNFQIVVEPTQPIEGIVSDATTGRPLPGVAVESYRMMRRGMSGERLVRTVSDKQGRYRLVGMPKGSGKQIMAMPNDEQPYLMREFDVPDQPGIGPINLDLDLHRGVWITGRVTNKTTGEPVNGRRTNAQYYPYRSNPFAQALPEYDNGNTHGYQLRYKVGEDGRFRLVGLPGKAIVGAQLWNTPYPQGQGSEQIKGANKSGHFPTYSLGAPATTKTPTVMREVDIPAGAEEFHVDLEVDHGRVVRIATVAPKGTVTRRLVTIGVESRRRRKNFEEPRFDVVALAAGEERTLLIHDEANRVGKALRVSEQDSPDSIKVTLEPCVTVRAQLVDDNQTPISGARIRFAPRPGGDFSPELENATTDEQGRFEHTGLLAGTDYDVMAESVQKGFTTLAKNLSVEPGETIDLGVIDVTDKQRPEPMRMKGDVVGAPAIAAEGTEFAGKVVDPTGKTVAGAELYLVFHIPEVGCLLTPKWKSLATTNAQGEFRFTVKPSDFGANATAREFNFGQIVATHKGFGFAWSSASLFETSGKALGKLRERLKTVPAPYAEGMQRMLAAAGQPLKLQVEKQPIRGQIVDINGQPVADARLTLLEVWSGQDANLNDSLDAWLEAAQKPKADYYSARMQTPRSMNGPQVRSLVQPAITDAEGRFQLSGVGDSRIAWLLLEGPGIESAKIWARTEEGEDIKLPRERRSIDVGFYTYHPARFTHIAGPSVAITGDVRDAESKEPLVGILVKSQKRHGEPMNGWGQDFVRALTDNQGRYRLEGMPIGKENRIAAIAPDGDVAYFSMSKRAATELANPSTINFDLRRGVWVEGRVNDKQTGEGLPGWLAYYVTDDNPNNRFARSLGVDERDRLRSDDKGRFRIAALPGPGLITFMAEDHQRYPRAKGILKADGSVIEAGQMIRANPTHVSPGNSHLLAEVNPDANARRVELNLQLDGGKTAVGRVVDTDGQAVTDYYHSGQLADFAGAWDRSKGDRFELVGYDPMVPRHVYFVHQERQLAGHMIVRGELPEDLVVELQPAGKVTGRLMDKKGEPLPNCQLRPYSGPMSSPADASQRRHAPPLPHNVIHSSSARYETDAAGRFEIAGLVPGVEYPLQAIDRDSMMSNRRRAPEFSGPLDAVIKVEPGESKDLGDVRLIDEKDSGEENKVNKSQPAATSETEEE